MIAIDLAELTTAKHIIRVTPNSRKFAYLTRAHTITADWCVDCKKKPVVLIRSSEEKMSNMMQIIVLATILGYASAVNQAVVFLQGTDITGNVTFTQETDGVSVEGRIVGLTKGDHGFHVHEKGDLTGGCATAGPHFNPGNKVHGGPSDSERHIGDLGNVNAQADGVATFKFSDSLISLTGANSIVGRAVVVHSDPDDFGKGGFPDSNTTGHSGTRVACGVIGIV